MPPVRTGPVHRTGVQRARVVDAAAVQAYRHSEIKRSGLLQRRAVADDCRRPAVQAQGKGASNGNYSLSNRVGPAVGTISTQSQFARARLFEAGREQTDFEWK